MNFYINKECSPPKIQPAKYKTHVAMCPLKNGKFDAKCNVNTNKNYFFKDNRGVATKHAQIICLKGDKITKKVLTVEALSCPFPTILDRTKKDLTHLFVSQCNTFKEAYTKKLMLEIGCNINVGNGEVFDVGKQEKESKLYLFCNENGIANYKTIYTQKQFCPMPSKKNIIFSESCQSTKPNGLCKYKCKKGFELKNGKKEGTIKCSNHLTFSRVAECNEIENESKTLMIVLLILGSIIVLGMIFVLYFYYKKKYCFKKKKEKKRFYGGPIQTKKKSGTPAKEVHIVEEVHVSEEIGSDEEVFSIN